MIGTVLADRLWHDASEVLFVSKEQFLHGLEGWESETIERDGELAFVFLTKGPEIHFHSFNRRHLILLLKMGRERVQKLIDTYGYALTRTPKIETKQHAFNRAFGFVQIAEDEFDVYYRIERVRGGSH